MAADTPSPRTGKTDSDIRSDVPSELAWDSRIDEEQIGVRVDRGIVFPGGTVDDRLSVEPAGHPDEGREAAR